MAVGGQGGVALMPKGFLPSLQSARVVELLSVGAGAILLGTLGLLFWAAFLGGLAVLFACYGIAALFRSRFSHPLVRTSDAASAFGSLLGAFPPFSSLRRKYCIRRFCVLE